MSFIKNIFGKKDESIKSYSDFWAWFQSNEKIFFNVVKSQKDFEKRFFDKLSSKLSELKDGYFYLTGMCDENTVELVFTADGNTSNIVFIEELVEEAPKIAGWKFTALKPALDIENVAINMEGNIFDKDNLFFYSNDDYNYPDEIDISIIHTDLTKTNRQKINIGTYIFLDNYLGELDFVNNIDNLKVLGKYEAVKELIPIAKLKEYLNWRQKEFVEKYEGVRYATQDEEHSIFEAEQENGNNLIAVINTDLLKWDAKASHPWVGIITFKYNGNNGMPDKNDYEILSRIEESLLEQLHDTDGYLYLGRQTGNNERNIYFACKDFRRPSQVFFKMQKDHDERFEIVYDIFKDKYWKSFERFSPAL